MLACTIACLWSEILAVGVLVSGSIIAIIFTVLAIRAIVSKTKLKTENKKGHDKAINTNLIVQGVLIVLGIMNYIVWW